MKEKDVLYASANVWDQSLQLGQKNIIQAIIDFFPKNVKNMLDVGCGDGKLTQAIRVGTGCEVHGLDASQKALSRCAFKTTLGNAEQLHFSDKEFDLVLSTDLLEHLNDEDEKKAWQELFRVAKNWVMVAVPFRERLLDGMAKCHHCGEQYHVNWHLRSYYWQNFIQAKHDDFEIDKIILTGEPWSPYSNIEIIYRRHVLDEWSGWKESFCPHCQQSGRESDSIHPFTLEIGAKLGEWIYSDLKNNTSHREHSEILVIYKRKNCVDITKFPSNMIEPVEENTNKIFLKKGETSKNLIPYPLVASTVETENEWVLQFPAYAPYEYIEIKGGTLDTQAISISIEDGEGLLLNTQRTLKSGEILTIVFSRKTRSSYYGIIVRLSKTADVETIQLGEGQTIFCLNPQSKEIPYATIRLENYSIYLQVYKQIYFDHRALLEMFSQKKHVLMLCHDQNIDRRILAQANSLIEVGHQVTLIALSHTNENSQEYLSEGIKLVRIGLNKVIPDNLIYKGYIKWQQRLNNRFLLLLKVLSQVNWMAYKIHLFLKYHNRRMGDPLPFRKAFFQTGKVFNADVIQVHDLPALQAGVELSEKWKVPLVYDAHELYPEQRTFSRVQRKICSEQEKKCIKKCQLVFTVNDSIAQEMASRYAIKQPITLLNALNPPKSFDENKAYNLLREKLKLSFDRKIVLFQGGFSRYRNLDNLIHAFKFVKNQAIDLVMMGFGDDVAILKNQAARLSLLNKRVYFLPAVSQSDLLSYTASADIGIIPYPHVDLNSYYCTPNKLFEFIQASLPILANDSPELRRFVQNEGFGIVKPMQTAKQIAQAIDFVFDETLYLVWKKRLNERKAQFTWDKQSAIYVKSMQALLCEKEASVL